MCHTNIDLLHLQYAKNKLNEIESLEKTLETQRSTLEQRRDMLAKELQEVESELADVVEKERAHKEEKREFQEANTSLLTALAEKESVRASQVRSNKVSMDSDLGSIICH